MKPGYRLHRAPGRIITGHPVIQLAIEMAANEETESRALSSEMALLEKEWRDAEEIASIADDLLIPGPIRSRLIAWKTDRSQ
ncbi:MAG TPA: hypothetical protein VFI91_12710 [Longimicrobiaceae bacterium]|nr:hypothetical protein [Longimicrobiaceae bacterium]